MSNVELVDNYNGTIKFVTIYHNLSTIDTRPDPITVDKTINTALLKKEIYKLIKLLNCVCFWFLCEELFFSICLKIAMEWSWKNYFGMNEQSRYDWETTKKCRKAKQSTRNVASVKRERIISWQAFTSNQPCRPTYF